MTERTAVIASANERRYFRFSSKPDAAWRLTLIEAAEQKAAKSATTQARAALMQTALLWMLELGLVDDAVLSYYAASPAVRTRLPVPLSACQAVSRQCGEGDRYRLTDELAAALWLTGHKDDARRWLQEEIADFGPRGNRARYHALFRIVRPRARRTGSLSTLHPRPIAGEPVPPRNLVELSLEGSGWLFQVRAAGNAVRRVFAARLRDAGYLDVAAALVARERPLRVTNGDPLLARVVAMSAAALRRRQGYWQERLADCRRERQQHPTDWNRAHLHTRSAIVVDCEAAALGHRGVARHRYAAGTS
jgi:hypothetical protein